MTEPAIQVCQLAKCYRIGRKQPRYSTLRDVLAESVARPFRYLGSRASATGEDPVEKTFDALRDVSFEVGHGEVVGIIGRNGAGKSTLLKILSRITHPSEGCVMIRGRVGALLEVGTGFHQELTGRENILLNGAILGMSRSEIQRKFQAIVDFSEVEQFLDTPVKHYSSGMYLRLAFAVAAHLDPEILLVDEVLAVGDAAFQRKCLGKMEEVAERGRTVLFVSHNMGAIRDLCHRAIWIDEGRLRGDGEAGSVIRDYLSTYTQGSFRYTNSQFGFSIEGVVLENSFGEPMLHFAPGDDLRVVIRYQAERLIERPYLAVAITGTRGPCFAANMLLDGFRPKALAGVGRIVCTFRSLPLLPQQYSVRLTVQTGRREKIVKNQEVAGFSVEGSLKDFGFAGEFQAMAADSTPTVIPYEWTLPDGSRGAFSLSCAEPALQVSGGI
jgi:lipopolysaccharide transport system ATP-binding protein